MLDPNIISKITRVQSRFTTYFTNYAKHKSGLYWFGFWQEKGKTKTVYIGKHLPEELEVLLTTRVKVPGHRQYYWPGQKGAE